VDLPIDRTLAPPLYDGVEQEPVKSDESVHLLQDSAQSPSTTDDNQNSLVTPIRILLPSINLVIHAERYTFFEATLGVSGPPVFQESLLEVTDKDKI